MRQIIARVAYIECSKCKNSYFQSMAGMNCRAIPITIKNGVCQNKDEYTPEELVERERERERDETIERKLRYEWRKEIAEKERLRKERNVKIKKKIFFWKRES